MKFVFPMRSFRATFIAAFAGACFAAMPTHAQEVACEPVTAVETAPPPLPDDDQPPIPEPGYIWSPGYWSWSADEGDYYWVPGVWAQPPRPGLLWTPGYWAWVAGAYIFHPGYWGPHIGYYGGVNYGFGYTGSGYRGGHWDHGAFFYNRAVNNFGGVTIKNVYEEKVVENATAKRASFNGGKGGVDAKPTADERAFVKEQHFAPTTLQRQHVEAASKDPSLFERSNKGAPGVGVAPRPGELKGTGSQPTATPNAIKPEGGEAKPTENKPNIEETRPRPEERKSTPSLEIKPMNEEQNPASETLKPTTEKRREEPPKKSETFSKPEPISRPEPKPLEPKPLMERPALHGSGPGASGLTHPPGKPEERKQP